MASPLSGDPPPRPVGHDKIGAGLHTPILAFDLPAEVEHLHQQDAWISGAGPSSTTLVKHPDLRVVLVALRKGEQLAEHRTVARITVHVLSGAVRLRLPNQIEDLKAGQIVALDRNLVHDVVAMEESAFLLTLAWPADGNAGKEHA